MRRFVLFFVSVKYNALKCGDPYMHTGVGVDSSIEDWREAHWTEQGLRIRVAEGEDESAYKAVVLAKAKTRKELCKLLSPGRTANGSIFYFNENGFHRDGNKPAVIYFDGIKEYYKDGKYISTECSEMEDA